MKSWNVKKSWNVNKNYCINLSECDRHLSLTKMQLETIQNLNISGNIRPGSDGNDLQET